MSRAMNVKLTEEQVTKLCRKAGVSISAIEPLPTEGTHLVCVTGAGADAMRLVLKKHIITSPVKRYPFYRAQ